MRIFARVRPLASIFPTVTIKKVTALRLSVSFFSKEEEIFYSFNLSFIHFQDVFLFTYKYLLSIYLLYNHE